MLLRRHRDLQCETTRRVIPDEGVSPQLTDVRGETQTQTLLEIEEYVAFD